MKRSQSQEIAYIPTATSSASALSRHAVSARPVAASNPGRPSSPPASSYFSPFSGEHNEEPQPASSEAQTHFAYSTSLVRHRENSLGLPLPVTSAGLIQNFGELKSAAEAGGAAGVWQRTADTVKAWFTFDRREKDEGYGRLPTSAQKEEQRQTPSEVYAHHTAEVCPTSNNLIYACWVSITRRSHLGHTSAIWCLPNCRPACR